MIEIGRGIMVRHVLHHAARKASWKTMVPGKTNADITAQIIGSSADDGPPSITPTVPLRGGADILAPIRGSAVDARAARARLDCAPVKVGMPVPSASWLSCHCLSACTVAAQAVVSLRQG